MELEKKLTKVEKDRCAEEEENEIVKEMLHEINKYFNNDNNTCTNQQLIENRDSFRGVIAK